MKNSESPSRRRHGRLLQEELKSNIGTVLDLSATGMRVITRHPLLRSTVTVKINSFTGLRVAVTCKVIWRERIGFMKYVLGLHIIDADPKLIEEIASLCRSHRIRRTL